MTEAIDTKKGRGWKVLATLLVLLAAAPLVFYVLLIMALKAHAKDDCRMQLRNIGVFCREYASSHEGLFPTNWEDLEPSLPSTNWHGVFICPATGHRPDAWNRSSVWADYQLLTGRATNDAPDTILAIEPLSNHGKGANVLFVDGSTAWWPASLVLSKQKRQ